MDKKRPRIYRRIVLFQFLGITVVMAVFGLVSFDLNLAREVRSMASATDRAAKRLSSGIAIPFWNLEKESVRSLLMPELQAAYLTGIVVSDANGIWLAVVRTDAGELVAVESRERLLPYLRGSQEGPVEEVTYADPRGKTWDLGELALYTTDQPIRATLALLLRQALLQAAVLFVTLSVLTVVVLHLLLNRPLQELTLTAQRIGAGDIELQAHVSGPREIATLAATFNGMTTRLRKSMEELDWYFANALEILCITDQDGTIRRLNKEWETTLGYTIEESKGRSILDFVHPDDQAETHAAVLRFRNDGELRDFVNRYRRKDGDYRWIEWRVFLHGGSIYASAQDITKRKQDEDEIRRLNDSLEARVAERTTQLEAANRELESFSYSVAHDLRAPLRAVNGFARIIIDDYGEKLDAEGTRVLSVIQNEAQRMDQMIHSLLSLSRIGRSALHLAVVDMSEMARSVFEQITDPETRARITFRVEALPEATADPALLRHVWTNLLSNAVKFTAKAAEPAIDVGGAIRGNELVYYLRDNGAGFDMRYAGKLFGVFQRLHAAQEFDGQGVGLALVQRIVLMHGGKVWAEGEVGKGAVFSFSLPRVAPA